MSKPRKVNYLNNKDILKEIHRSKNTWCWYEKPEYSDFDGFIEYDQVDNITDEQIEQLVKNRHARLCREGNDPDWVSEEDVVVRVMCYDHIPVDDQRKRKAKTEKERHLKLNFPPFKHYRFTKTNQGWKAHEVGRSHWRGDLISGEFDKDHGHLTPVLVNMIVTLAERYTQRGNWRGYTYVDDMKSQVLLNLTHAGLKFDESKSQNPFGYWTTIASNACTHVFNEEKRNQTIRDKVLVNSGHSPSYTYQLELEEQAKQG